MTYPSGTIVTRKIKGEKEDWHLKGNALCTSIFKIDLEKCENIVFVGDEDETIKIISVPPLKNQKMFTIKKDLENGHTFNPQFHLEEKPLPLEEQREYTVKQTDEIEEKVSRMEEAFKTLPFEIMPESDLKEEIKKLGLDHFVDPHFPPRDTSIH